MQPITVDLNENYQPRFRAYLNEKGKVDGDTFRNIDFMFWIDDKWSEFFRKYPEVNSYVLNA